MKTTLKPMAALAGALIFSTAMQVSTQNARAQDYYQQSPPQLTYLVNGLVSAVPFIGYGMANLKKRIKGAHLYSYLSPIEGTTIIQPKIMREVRAAYKQNPRIQVNLIGISYGATMVTSISAALAKENIPVHYLGVIDGRPLSPIHANVDRVDNFRCVSAGCIGTGLRMARGNRSSERVEFKIRSPHIKLGDNRDMHNRVIQQISAASRRQSRNAIDYRATATVPKK